MLVGSVTIVKMMKQRTQYRIPPVAEHLLWFRPFGAPHLFPRENVF